MDFINNTVEPDSLPRAEELIFKPIERTYWKVLQWRWTITSTILFALAIGILVVVEARDFVIWITVLSSLIILFALAYWMMRKSFLQKGFVLREHDILYRSGWLIRRVSVCPFNRVQHCSIHAGPLEKKVGLATLQMFTAGTSGTDMRIPGLKESDAVSLRDFIMKKTTRDELEAN